MTIFYRFLKSILVFFPFASLTIYAQISITRGAGEGEIYISTDWYHEGYNTHYGIFFSSDNGANIELKYQSTELPPAGEMRISELIGDAKMGTLYNYGAVDYGLWVSNDYGINWESVEYPESSPRYTAGCYEGEVYKCCADVQGTVWRSTNFGYTFNEIGNDIKFKLEVGVEYGTVYGLAKYIYPETGFYLNISRDFAENFSEIPIDSSVAFYQIGGYYPEISRGALAGELYLVSWWPDYHYKIFHSVDTGYTWSEQFESGYIDTYYWRIQYSAGRAPGSFYVLSNRIDPITQSHILLYINYSNDYGQTFTTYFHDLTAPVGIINTLNMEPMIKAYPNPFSHLVTFEFILSRDFVNPRLQIFDISNRQIIEINLDKSSKITWNGSDRNHNRLNDGIYCYRVIAENYESPVYKLILIDQ